MHSIQRLLPALLLAPLALALACDEPADLAELDDSRPAAAHESDLDADLDLADPQQTDLGLAAQLAAHPSFAPLSQRAWTRTGQFLTIGAGLTPAERDLSRERLEYCQINLPAADCTAELQALGLTTTASAQDTTPGQALNNAFNLDALTYNQRLELFVAARAIHLANGGVTPGPSFVPSTLGGQTCDSTCKTHVLKELAAPHAAVMTIFASDTGNGGGSTSALWVPNFLEIIDIIIWPCWILDCHDWWPWNDNDDHPVECDSDNDCASSEYCWRGPLSVGDNECRDRRENGDWCSRDGKCESDCCKFNLFDGGSTCRPAGECN